MRASVSRKVKFCGILVVFSLLAFLAIPMTKIIAEEERAPQPSISKMLEELRESIQMAIVLRQRQLPEEKEKDDDLLRELNYQLDLVGRIRAMLLGERGPSPRPTVVTEVAPPCTIYVPRVMERPEPIPPDADSSRKKIELPKVLVERMPVNGDFEDDLNGWTKWFGFDQMDSERVCEVVYDEDLKSHVVEFRRSGGGVEGSIFGLAQDIYIDLDKYDELYLKLDVKAVYQSLTGGGWAGSAEYPVIVELAFLDQNGIGYKWRHGFYYKDESKYKDCTKIPQNEWFSYTSPDLKGMVPVCADPALVADAKDWGGWIYHEYKPPVIPKAITRILIFGGGWDFVGRADNIRFETKP
jgi:hypothetical protein